LTSTNRRVTDPPARAVFALLVVGCFVAFFLTQHLKHTPTAVQAFRLTPRFSPTAAGHVKEARISFKLAQSDAVTVTIVDSSGTVVATLLRNFPAARYKQLSLRWNGRRGTLRRLAVSATADGVKVLRPTIVGPPAAGGDYRVRVSLRDEHRAVLLPRSFTLERP
jgi:hypothetical protein